MEIRVLSDLHFEFIQDQYNPDRGRHKLNRYFDHKLGDADAGDVLAVPGDVSHGEKEHLEAALEELTSWFDGPTVYTAGNHEYYGSDFIEINNRLGELDNELENFHWLNKKQITIDGQRFVGATLWFPKTPQAEVRSDSLNDFKRIRGFTPDVYEHHEAERQWLDENIETGDVVLTHHIPASFCVPERYQNDPLNCFYNADVPELIDNKPALWCFGHTHDTIKKQKAGIKFVCNPLGYPNKKENHAFEPECTATIVP